MKKIQQIALLSIFVAGCSSMSPIEKESESKSHFEGALYEGRDFYISPQEIEGERYRIYHRASTGFSGTGGIRRSATQRANRFCEAMGKNKRMVTVSEHTAAPPYILGNFPRIEIIFVCADGNAAEISKGGGVGKYDRIVKIKELYDSGALTKEEYEAEKQKILSER
jgi:Short C-terminal domain